ncbi:MAG TPA: glutathione S-transferase family protein [Nannocystaceae bacterium]|nr:glutathione S-transferase family protein [Nannocystaceae bacterium]
MPKIKLTYFDFAGSRGEECRLALHLAGVDFHDDRLANGVWPQLKPDTPFGSLPVLEVEGKGRLAQSNAILRYVGTQHGLHPSDPWEAARHDAILAVCEELRGKLGHSLATKDEEEKKRLREELAKGYLQQWGRAVEQQIGDGPFVAGAKINVADLKLFIVANWLMKGTLDHIPKDVFADYPKLNKLVDAVKNHPDVQRWYAPKS